VQPVEHIGGGEQPTVKQLLGAGRWSIGRSLFTSDIDASLSASEAGVGVSGN
jgi:hypothetical protein